MSTNLINKANPAGRVAIYRTMSDGLVPVEILKLRHDGNPNQEFPTGLYLVDVKVKKATPNYPVGYQLCLSGTAVEVATAGLLQGTPYTWATMHVLAKKGVFEPEC